MINLPDQIHEAGGLICVGAADGSASLIQLDSSLASCSKLDRTNASDMFDRELRRERILFNREKAIKVAEKQAEIKLRMQEMEKQEEEKQKLAKGCPIKRAETLFYEHLATVRQERGARQLALKSVETPGSRAGI